MKGIEAMCSRENVEAAVCKFWDELLGLPTGSVSADVAIENLSIDSIDLMQIIVEFENRFAVSIEDDEAVALQHIDDFIQLAHTAHGSHAPLLARVEG
jgi:acyl carrier protein